MLKKIMQPEPGVSKDSGLRQLDRRLWGGLIAASVSGVTGAGAALAVSCCAGPALFIAIGLGTGGASFFEKLAPYRFLFSVASVVMLMFAFWGLYFRKQKECKTNCSPGVPKTSKIIFWITVVIVAASIIIPPAIDAVMIKR